MRLIGDLRLSDSEFKACREGKLGYLGDRSQKSRKYLMVTLHKSYDSIESATYRRCKAVETFRNMKRF